MINTNRSHIKTDPDNQQMIEVKESFEERFEKVEYEDHRVHVYNCLMFLDKENANFLDYEQVRDYLVLLYQ